MPLKQNNKHEQAYISSNAQKPYFNVGDWKKHPISNNKQIHYKYL